MALFFRIVQSAEGHWACRQGRHEFDTHPDRAGAIAHIRALAAASANPVQIYCHSADGTIEQLPTAEPEPDTQARHATPPGGPPAT